MRLSTIAEALELEAPDYVVVCKKTSEHFAVLEELAKHDFTGKILVEKPLFSDEQKLLPNNFKELLVGYNLRFAPIISEFRKRLSGEVYSVQSYVGQYLPTWRSSGDYRDCYSAKKEEGGGVLRDLSHELDLLTWLFGDFKHLSSKISKSSSLDISSEDIATLLFQTDEKVIGSLEMNYLAKVPLRHMIVNSSDGLYFVDLVNNTLSINQENIAVAGSLADSYVLQHSSILSDDSSLACSAAEGLGINKLISVIEEADKKESWLKV